MSGAGIMLMSQEGLRGSLCTSNKVSDLIERMQYDLGEGPCVDAYEMDRPVLEPNLRDPKDVRWMGFRERALEAGVGAVFGFPMHIGAVRIGALNLYRNAAGDNSGSELTRPWFACGRMRLETADASAM